MTFVYLLLFCAVFGICLANDYSISSLDPRCASATTELACTALGAGCVFTANVCQFDRSLKCSSSWGTVYKTGLQKSLSCGATASDHCPSPSCTEAAAEIYAALRMKYSMTDFVSYNSLFFTIALWPKANQTALEQDLALCSSEVTTSSALAQSAFSPDACMVSDDLAKSTYAAAISGSMSSSKVDGSQNLSKSDAYLITLWTVLTTVLIAAAAHIFLH